MNNRLTLIITAYILIASLPCTAMLKKVNHAMQPLTITTMYKDFTVTEPVLIDLLHDPIMERIKHVKQYGTLDYAIKPKKQYTRYEHCVGVWTLLRMYGATVEEQIAGLLHDASHTVFSHVGDVLFKHTSSKSSYQDDIHEWYLKQWGIDELLERHNISLANILHKSGTHTMLEQDLPNICADRLEYNLQAGILTDMLTTDDVATILADLQFSNEQWFFTNQESAQKLGFVSLFNTEHVWSSNNNRWIYEWTTLALQRAIDIKLLTTHDIHFSTDPIVWDKLWTSNDQIIIIALTHIINYKELKMTTQYSKSPLIGKFRGLDPLVHIDNQFKRLTTVNSDYCKEYNRVKELLIDTKKANL